ncbi:MAG: response regulator [Nevskiales bacterium]|nr:response regulator [Nevskiales bacterium]
MTQKTVLVADDEENIVVSLEFLLRQLGCAVKVARDGDEAIAMIREHRPDLVLLDVMMPARSGYEVCQMLRDDPALRQTPVIMLTAKGREAEIARGRAVGADVYVTKPFSTRELSARIRGMLDLPEA